MLVQNPTVLTREPNPLPVDPGMPSEGQTCNARLRQTCPGEPEGGTGRRDRTASSDPFTAQHMQGLKL